MKCPECHFDNPDDTRFCGNCAAPLRPGEEISVPETRTLRTPVKEANVGEIIAEKFKLLEELGKGGMGIVYKAQQIKPVKRTVALKIIKLGMDTRQVVARFDAERQALAVMDHPNIAKVYDAGAAESGRPYFAMELVRGVPITEYSNKYKLSTRERLELFIPLCQAVQHAHQKGVIHRDLKPSNVLVAVQEDKPVPKIIDFGIAKATEHRLTERTLFTEQGQLVGTPEYMSPEQAEMSGLDVDTRTDIYSLGVMLYELLVGVLPFDPETLRKAGFAEIQRVIQETDPPKVSTRLSGLGDTQTSIAEHRKTDVASLHRELKGDLDWISMKAMAKDRTQRYASASELAADIVRHLRNEPIIARPPSTIYRFKKYIRRHKVGVVAAAFVVLAILIGIAGTSLGLIRAKQAEKVASNEAAKAKAINKFLQETLGSANPRWGLGRDATILEALDLAVERIDESFVDEPEIEAAVRNTIGRTYMELARYDIAESLLRSALELRQEIFGNDHPDIVASLGSLSQLALAKGDHGSAESLLRQQVSISRNFEGKDRLLLAMSLNDLAIVLSRKRENPEAIEALYQESLSIYREILGSESHEVAVILGNLAVQVHKRGDYEKAESQYREVLRIERKLLGKEHPDLALTMHNLAFLLYDKGEYANAESLLRDALAINAKALGESHPSMSSYMSFLAMILVARQRYEEAERFFQEAAKVDPAVLKVEVGGPWSAEMKSSYGELLTRFGRYEEAERYLLSTFDKLKNRYGENDKRIQRPLNRLIGLYDAWGKPDKAAEYRAVLIKSDLEK